jgi:hypothetical protein
VKTLRSRLRRPSYAEATASLALFVALGGTGYAAAALPSNSVGSRQIRTAAVGKSELRSGSVGKSEVRTNAVGKSEIAASAVGAIEVRHDAIGTNEVKDGDLGINDLSTAARDALTGASAVTFREAVTSAGAAAGGNAKSARRAGTGDYTVDLGRDVSDCQFAATLAGVKSGTSVEAPHPGFVTVTPATGATTVRVVTTDPTGAPADSPFDLLVAC